jgi:hypothetical protein
LLPIIAEEYPCSSALEEGTDDVDGDVVVAENIVVGVLFFTTYD